ncbi:MAG: hypothetical protein KF838_11585 [Phycisphaeraceae bacterium]|nr:MAG: hypothetical protein KF838_11585 [Phycisphaeraceae bacterium]
MQPNGTEIWGAGAAVATGAALALAAVETNPYTIGAAALSCGVWSTLAIQYLRNKPRSVSPIVAVPNPQIEEGELQLELLPSIKETHEKAEALQIAASAPLSGIELEHPVVDTTMLSVTPIIRGDGSIQSYAKLSDDSSSLALECRGFVPAGASNHLIGALRQAGMEVVQGSGLSSCPGTKVLIKHAPNIRLVGFYYIEGMVANFDAIRAFLNQACRDVGATVYDLSLSISRFGRVSGDGHATLGFPKDDGRWAAYFDKWSPVLRSRGWEMVSFSA